MEHSTDEMSEVCKSERIQKMNRRICKIIKAVRYIPEDMSDRFSDEYFKGEDRDSSRGDRQGIDESFRSDPCG